MARWRKSRTDHADTSDQPPASDPNPTTTSPPTSVATGGTATASLLPSSALPSGPPTTATATQPVLSAPIPPPSLASAIATNQPPLRAPPLSFQETHQEHISGTSVGTTTTADFAGPSTAPSLSAVTKDFLFQVVPNFTSTLLKIEGMTRLSNMVLEATDWRPTPMDSEIQFLIGEAEIAMKLTSDFAADMEEIRVSLQKLTTLLLEKIKRYIGSGGSGGGSERQGGGPDSSSGGGDDQGGGVCV